MGEAADPELRRAHGSARVTYDAKIKNLQSIITGRFGQNPANFEVATVDAAVATVDLVKTGLDLYLEAAAAARESEKRIRESEARNRTAIGWLTAAVMVATVVSAIAAIHGAYKAPDRITVPAPTVTDISICPSR